MHYKAVFISDIHLGTPGCQADALLEFLKRDTCDQLYLVGDIIDGWALRRRCWQPAWSCWPRPWYLCGTRRWQDRGARA